MNDRTVIRPGGRRPIQNNPAEDDRTVVRSPRQRQPIRQPERYSAPPPVQPRRPEPPPPQPRYQKEPPPPREMPGDYAQFADNPLLELVSPLISLVSKVSNARENVDVEELRRHAVAELEEFNRIGFCLPNDQRLVRKASYGLCCLLDELVLNTPWGSQSSWSTDSLLVYFHQEAWGGENFFAFLDELSANPSANFTVLELYFVAMDMGFEGKYRQLPNGQRDVSNIKNDLYVLLTRYRNTERNSLSPKWRGVVESKNTLLNVIPQWVVWSIASGLAILMFISLSILLGQKGDPVQRRIATNMVDQPLAITPGNLSQLGQANFRNVVEPDLEDEIIDYRAIVEEALEFEIFNDMVVVEAQEEGTLVRLVDANLFRSGSDLISKEYAAVVEKLGKSLSQHRIQVEVTGHTDNIPIRTLRFANNWALSTARADTVKTLLIETLHRNSRVSARGMADTKPIASNDTEQQRAQNRRVEIMILG